MGVIRGKDLQVTDWAKRLCHNYFCCHSVQAKRDKVSSNFWIPCRRYDGANGPFCVTLDIVFNDRQTYEKVKATVVLNAKKISQLYPVPESEIKFFECDAALAFKASMKRPIFSGDSGDSDVYGAQQHAPLLDIEIPF
jgi:hypothetical protein